MRPWTTTRTLVRNTAPAWARVLLLCAVSALCAVLTISGCGRTGGTPSPDDRVNLTTAGTAGTWIDATDGSRIELDPGGGFTATSLPYQIFQGFPGVLPSGYDPARDRVRASGRWSLSAPAVDPGGPRNHVSLHVTTLMGRPVSTGADLRAETQDNAVVLVCYIGDPDLRNRRIYRRR